MTHPTKHGVLNETLDEFSTRKPVATVCTLRGFIAAVHELTGIVRDIMLPALDMKAQTEEAR